MPRFQKGQSGNPAGRPKGVATKQTRLRKQIESHIPGILESLVKSAKDGDTGAAKLLLERVLPSLRPVDAPVAVPLGEGLAQAGERVLEALSASKVTPDEAAKVIASLTAQARLVEAAELAKRVDALEQQMGQRK